MNNYINIDMLRKNMMRLQEHEHKYLYTHEVFNEIWNMPLADVRESVHGEWILLDGYRCSKCNYKLQTTGLSSYCPSCGADMRGE